MPEFRQQICFEQPRSKCEVFGVEPSDRVKQDPLAATAYRDRRIEMLFLCIEQWQMTLWHSALNHGIVQKFFRSLATYRHPHVPSEKRRITSIGKYSRLATLSNACMNS
jgi:hypothetical protein